jgi:PKD repeat protein
MVAVVCCIFAAPIHCIASDGSQPFVVASDLFGSSNFSMINGDGTLTEQQEVIRFEGGSDDWSYSNGVGDFDNDGVLDLILAVGNEAGVVYLYGKIENDQFVEQNSDIQWSRGRYPGRMAVADFDEDGYLDFIMTYDGSIDCDLYKGNGNLEFTPIELQDTAPQNSIGADSGDFNGDGHADFVAVSYTWGEAYINYGNGDGTFNSEVIYLNPYNYGHTSVTAADFNGDGLDDLAVSHSMFYVYIYLNYGDSTFGYANYIVDGNFYSSPIDAYDFDDDGNQDLVIGGYRIGNTMTGIAVMTVLGNGNFNPAAVYGGAPEGLAMITSISAPTLLPAEVISNINPVAAIFCDPAQVAAGETVVVDGQDSYDEDGDIVSYQWNFGDGSLVQEKKRSDASDIGSELAEHVYYDVGEYTITLTVTDDQGATGSEQFTVQVSAIDAGVRVLPRPLNLKSRGRWMHAWVQLPDECDAIQVDVNAIEVVEDESTQLVDLNARRLKVRTNRWLAKRNRFYVKFDRRATINAIGKSSGRTTIRINGEAFCNGDFVEYSGDDQIKTIDPSKKKKKKIKKRRSKRNHRRCY